MFKSGEERAAARREREAEEAEWAREREEERQREEFLATPYGAAKTAMDAGEAAGARELLNHWVSSTTSIGPSPVSW